MNDVWNLDPIYTGFDDPAFSADLEAMSGVAKEMAAFAADLKKTEPLEGLRKGIALQEQFSDLVGKLAGYSQRQLSEKLELEAVYTCRGSVSRIESGVRAVTDIELAAIAKILGVSVDKLFDVES